MKAQSCIFCKSPLESSFALGQVCEKCESPQPLAPSENYFTLLGAEEKFKQDLPSLEKRFYEVSRILHPDRFSNSEDSKKKDIALSRMSELNQAYQTLKTPTLLREYLLKLHGIQNEKPAVPTEFAEEWFQVQEQVMDEPEEALAHVGAFEGKLHLARKDLETQLKELEELFDTRGDRSTLEKIQKLGLQGQYFQSMKRDLDRLKLRLGL